MVLSQHEGVLCATRQRAYTQCFDASKNKSESSYGLIGLTIDNTSRNVLATARTITTT